MRHSYYHAGLHLCPLSFVTGIFGMNLNKVNDSPLPYWAFFIAVGAVLFLTAAIFGSWFLWHRRKKQKASNKHNKVA